MNSSSERVEVVKLVDLHKRLLVRCSSTEAQTFCRA